MRNKILKIAGGIAAYAAMASNAFASSLDTAIASASTTFNTTTGFSIGDFVTYGVDLLKQGIGLGLYVFQQTWPVWLAIAAILIVIRIAKHGWSFIGFGGSR
jgi:hypothetical protein